MPSQKLYLITYTLTVAVTSEVVSSHTNTLGESMFPMIKTFLKLLFWYALHDGHHMSMNVSSDWKTSILGIARSSMGQIWRIWWMVQFQYWFLCQKLPNSKRVMTGGHSHYERIKHQTKAQVFSHVQPYVTLPIFPNNNAGSLFDHTQRTQSKQCPCDEKDNTEFSSHGLIFLCSLLAIKWHLTFS